MAKTKQCGKLNIDVILKGKLEGKKKKDIAVEAGSKAVGTQNQCHALSQAEKSKEYKEKSKHFITLLDKEINRLMDSISNKSHSLVMYKDAVSSIEKLAKLKELLSGGVTERTELTGKEVADYLANA